VFVPFLITNDDRRVRDAVQEALKKEPNYHTLKEALRNENQAIRIEAALLLCEQGQQDDSQILLDAIHTVSKKEQERIVNFLIKVALKNQKITSIINNIPITITIRSLKSSQWEERKNCAIHLGKAKVKEAVPNLIKALDDSDYDVRREAAKALGLIGDSRAEKRLAEVVENDSDDKVKKAATQALIKIRENKTNG
jgi:HEAT repeat protein